VKWIVVATLCACLGAAADARADHGKIDHLELTNGDRLTCEVRGLDSAPPSDQKKNDSSVMAAIGWTF